MIVSACKDMRGFEIIYTTVSNFLYAVHKACGDELLRGMGHYPNADDQNRITYHISRI